jgi:hypothetical protein
MARAVAQRKQVPYLLIVFVFLFFVAAILAIVRHMDGKEQAKIVAQLTRKIDVLALDHQLDDPTISSLMDEVNVGNEDSRVIPQLQQRIADLDKVITGEKTTYANALNVANAALADHGGQPSLLALVEQTDRGLADSLVKLAEEARLRRDEQERASQDIVNKNAQISDLQAAQRKQDEEIIALREEVAQYRQEHDARVTELDGNASDEKRELNAKITELVQDLSEAKVQIKQKDREIEAQERQLASLLARKVEGGYVFIPDGKVIEVVDGEIAYINIGQINGVIPGMTFSVLPQTGKIDDLKAKLVVVKVHEKASECQIVELISQRHPVTVNDLLHNISFDETRDYTFVFTGRFDLHGTGRASMRDTDEAIAMVKRFGGVVVDEVTPGVDFIVLGAEPEHPMQPSEDADPTIWQAYQENMKVYEAYVKTQNEAERLGLPVLNTNRFLDMIGYKPIQTLKY